MQNAEWAALDLNYNKKHHVRFASRGDNGVKSSVILLVSD